MDENCKPSRIKRNSCIDCALKHLGQAYVLFKETKKDYPKFYIYVMGHMAEAEDELAIDHNDQANLIRDQRILYSYDEEYIIPFDELVTNLYNYNKELASKLLKELGHGEPTIADIQASK